MNLSFLEKTEGDTRHFSYFLHRKGGNILFNPIDDAAFLKKSKPMFDAAGGVKWIFLTHGGDACPAARYVHDQYGATLYGHDVWDADKAKVRSKVPIGAKFSGNHVFEKEIEVIDATGHCPYFHAFLFKAGGKTHLLTSDMLEGRAGGKWAVNVPERLVRQGIDSLERLFGMDFDFLCPSFAHKEWDMPLKLGPTDRRELKESLLAVLRKKHKIK
jgi:hypothetical protein